MLSLPNVKSLLLSAQPGLLETLGNHCINMKTSWKALRMLGLWHHPGVQALLTSLGNKRSLSREGRAKIVEIIFHVDGPTLMQTLPPLEDPPENPPVPPAPDVDAGPALPAVVGEQPPPAHGGPVLDVEPPPFAKILACWQTRTGNVVPWCVLCDFLMSPHALLVMACDSKQH